MSGRSKGVGTGIEDSYRSEITVVSGRNKGVGTGIEETAIGARLQMCPREERLLALVQRRQLSERDYSCVREK